MHHFIRWWYANQIMNKVKCKKCNSYVIKKRLTENGCINCDSKYHYKKRKKK